MTPVPSQPVSLLVDFPSRPRRSTVDDKVKTTRQRSINFTPDITVFSYSNDSSNDIQSHDLWYTSQEYKQMKHTRSQDICAAIRIMQSPEFKSSVSSQHLNLIGVERYLSREVLVETKRRRDAHVNAVLDEQERQDSNMISDLKTLGDLSRTHSKWSVERSQIAARFSRMLDDV